VSAAVTVLASDGSATSSLVFGAPVAAVLLALLAMTLRDRLRERRDR
jgi:hypothetical protein